LEFIYQNKHFEQYDYHNLTDELEKLS